MITRRDWLQASSAFAAAVALGPRSSFAQPVKTLKVGFGQKAISPNLINLLIGEVLGYNAAEGFKVEGMALGGNANVQVATDKGDVDVGVGVPSTALPILSKGEWKDAVNFYEYTYPYKWDIAVKKGAPEKSYTDLKGKNSRRLRLCRHRISGHPRVLRHAGTRPGSRCKMDGGRQRHSGRRRAGAGRH